MGKRLSLSLEKPMSTAHCSGQDVNQTSLPWAPQSSQNLPPSRQQCPALTEQSRVLLGKVTNRAGLELGDSHPLKDAPEHMHPDVSPFLLTPYEATNLFQWCGHHWKPRETQLSEPLPEVFNTTWKTLFHCVKLSLMLAPSPEVLVLQYT